MKASYFCDLALSDLVFCGLGFSADLKSQHRNFRSLTVGKRLKAAILASLVTVGL